MTIIPVKLRSFWHPLRGAGRIEFKAIPRDGPNMQVYSIGWSGFPRGGLAAIEVTARYPSGICQRTPVNVEGAAQGTHSVMFQPGPDGRLPEIGVKGLNRRGGTVFISEIIGGK